jgi:hypothetical protein
MKISRTVIFILPIFENNVKKVCPKSDGIGDVSDAGT